MRRVAHTVNALRCCSLLIVNFQFKLKSILRTSKSARPTDIMNINGVCVRIWKRRILVPSVSGGYSAEDTCWHGLLADNNLAISHTRAPL